MIVIFNEILLLNYTKQIGKKHSFFRTQNNDAYSDIYSIYIIINQVLYIVEIVCKR